MTDQLESQCESQIRDRLEGAGPAGLTRSQFPLPKKQSPKRAAFEQALQALLKSGDIGNLGTRARPRFVAKAHFRPLELAYEHIEALARENGGKLAAKRSFEKGLKGAVRARVDEALKLLVSEGRLLRLRWAGFPVYLHVSALPGALRSAPSPAVAEPPALNTVRAAWRRVADRFGYPDVPIAEVHALCGGDLAAFKQLLRRACREGLAVAGGGDWSLASPAERAAAIDINDRPHLRIRFV